MDGVEISNVVWKDNKLVTLLSTFAGRYPIHDNTKRYDRKQKKNVIIMCSDVIKQYNKFMDGVELIDSLLGRYKITLKSRNWYMGIFYHLIDVTATNAWLLYRQVILQLFNEKKLPLAAFKTQVAEALSNSGPAKRGRPSLTLQTQIEYKPTAADYPILQSQLQQTIPYNNCEPTKQVTGLNGLQPEIDASYRDVHH